MNGASQHSGPSGQPLPAQLQLGHPPSPEVRIDEQPPRGPARHEAAPERLLSPHLSHRRTQLPLSCSM